MYVTQDNLPWFLMEWLGEMKLVKMAQRRRIIPIFMNEPYILHFNSLMPTRPNWSIDLVYIPQLWAGTNNG